MLGTDKCLDRGTTSPSYFLSPLSSSLILSLPHINCWRWKRLFSSVMEFWLSVLVYILSHCTFRLFAASALVYTVCIVPLYLAFSSISAGLFHTTHTTYSHHLTMFVLVYYTDCIEFNYLENEQKRNGILYI